MKKGFNAYQIQERGQISPLQLAILGITFVVSTVDIFLPSFIAQEASRDSWISVIIGTVFSIIVLNIFLTLGLKYPEKTLVQYPCDILGKVLGKIIGFLYVYYFIFFISSIIRELGEIFVISFNPSSPIIIYIIIVVIVAMYAVFNGIEVIARVTQILFPIGMAVLLLSVIINIPNMDFNNFYPIFFDGYYPSIKGGLLVNAWMIETIILLQFLPFTSEKYKLRKYLNISLVFLGVSMMLGVSIMGVFGRLTGKLIFPALQYVRYATIGRYIQNLDVFIIIVWVGGIFIKSTLAYYAAVLGLSQLVETKSYKNFILPVSIIVVIFSLSNSKTIIELINFLHYIFPIYSVFMGDIIPIILLIVYFIRKKRKCMVT